MKPLSSRFIAVLLLAGVLDCAGQADLRPMSLAYSENIFQGANLTDVKASTKVWVADFGRKWDLCSAGNVFVFEHPEQWREACADKRFALGVLHTMDYLNMEKDLPLDPAYTFKDAKGVSDELLLVVHRDSKIETLADLKGQAVCYAQDQYSELAPVWLDVLLNTNNLPLHQAFFSDFTAKKKVSAVILSVFFRKSAACIISSGGYEVMKELNPQVGLQTRILASSPRLLPSVVCFNRNGQPELIAQLHRAFSNLHTDEAGRQFLLTFRVECFEPFKPQDMANVRALVRSYRTITSGTETAN